jgi:hypothetical protein
MQTLQSPAATIGQPSPILRAASISAATHAAAPVSPMAGSRRHPD